MHMIAYVAGSPVACGFPKRPLNTTKSTRLQETNSLQLKIDGWNMLEYNLPFGSSCFHVLWNAMFVFGSVSQASATTSACHHNQISASAQRLVASSFFRHVAMGLAVVIWILHPVSQEIS